MSVIAKRDRLVNFRLTESELDKLMEVVRSRNVRCLSDFCRQAVMAAAKGGDKIEQMEDRLITLEIAVFGTSSAPID